MGMDDAVPSETTRHGIATLHGVRVPHDPVVCFNVILKLVKHLLFNADASQRPHYGTMCCNLHTLMQQWFAKSLSLRLHHCRDAEHRSCPPPYFPSAVLKVVAESNHIIQSHLVHGDTLVVIVEQDLRKAITLSHDFAVVLALLLQDMARRVDMLTERGELNPSSYADEAVRVMFNNVVDRGDTFAAVSWSIIFPARRVHAAFLANRALWLGLQHTPYFTATQVGEKAAAAQRARLDMHTLSPAVAAALLLPPRATDGRSTGAAPAAAAAPAPAAAPATAPPSPPPPGGGAGDA